ncbi:MAG: pyridoxamine 5'-phosphate oxidase family protein [Treponema sp.]|nr:pyridoxamine 5'-phosphate oxidase family protein [Treponema sp.]
MRNMRRKDREMSREFALEVADKCLFASLATVNDDGSPYSVALSPVREGDWFYIHGALEGHKIDNMRREKRVCLSFVSRVEVVQEKNTVSYDSAVVFGTAEEVTDPNEKIHALRLICERYAPRNIHNFDVEISAGLEHTAVWKIHIDGISGKAH